MNRLLKLGLFILVFVAPALIVRARVRDNKSLQFEVATIKPDGQGAGIKPSAAGGGGGGLRPLPGGQTYVAQNVPVRLMIMLMFHLTDSQVSGGPPWINSDLWEVNAKAEHPTSIDDLHVMFQNLLIDRFDLKFHRETRELPAYALTVDKSGSKLTLNNSPDTFDFPIKGTGRAKITARRCSIAYFTWFLAGLAVLGRPVVDKTALPGFYDFELAWMPAQQAPDGELQDPALADRPNILTAVREQLGLRLEAQRSPVDVMVIDHISRPEGN